jgi:hypothetical protein
MNNILVEVNYKKYEWQICGDLKVIASLLGLQASYAKYSCFLCEWDSHARGTHCSRKHWLLRKSIPLGIKNVII